MTPKQFKDAFNDLVKRALSESPAPVHQMILEFEMAKATCVNILMRVEGEKTARELATKILPANGKFSEIKFDN